MSHDPQPDGFTWEAISVIYSIGGAVIGAIVTMLTKAFYAGAKFEQFVTRAELDEILDERDEDIRNDLSEIKSWLRSQAELNEKRHAQTIELIVRKS